MANNSLAPNTTRERSTWERGKQAEFRVAFVRKDGSPIVSLDAAKYPSFAIYTPSGLQIQTGVAQSFGSPGSYRILWTVPVDAELSNDKLAWVLEVVMVDSKKKQYNVQTEFNVVDKQVTSQENRDLILLGIENYPFRVNWRGDAVPFSIAVSAFKSDAPDNADTAPIPIPVTPTGPIIDGDSIAYIYNVPANILKPGMYTFIWQVQETSSSPSEIEYQQLRVIPRTMLQMIPQVKFVTNRFQAAFDLPNFISDADYVEGLQHGLEFINQWHPISFYSYSDLMTQNGMTSPLSSFWIMASAWWVLHSQHLVEANLAFSMSGATTSLDYDRTGPIESAMGRLREEMAQNLTPAKISFGRIKNGIGQLSVRPAQLRNYQGRVYRVEQTTGLGTTSQLYSMMTTLGIAP